MHALRNRSGDMLRGDLQVAGDMVPAEVLQIARPVRHHQIMPNPRADKDPPHPGNGPKPAQQLHLEGVVFL